MLELIECDGCGRHFATLDAPGMLAAITGVRPTCAGSFRLAPDNVAWPPTPCMPIASRDDTSLHQMHVLVSSPRPLSDAGLLSSLFGQ